MIQRFFPWLLIVAFVLSVAACAPTSAQPTATPAFTVAPTLAADATKPLVLVLPNGSEQKTVIAANRHYSDAVKQKGWNVEFYTMRSSGGDGTDDYLHYVQKQLSSGIAQADGYFCVGGGPGDAQTLQQAKSNGQLYDCAAVAASVVPQYWAKFQDQISAAQFGLALANQMVPVRILQPVLLVRDDFLPAAGQGMTGYDNLRVARPVAAGAPGQRICAGRCGAIARSVDRTAGVSGTVC